MELFIKVYIGGFVAVWLWMAITDYMKHGTHMGDAVAFSLFGFVFGLVWPLMTPIWVVALISMLIDRRHRFYKIIEFFKKE